VKRENINGACSLYSGITYYLRKHPRMMDHSKGLVVNNNNGYSSWSASLSARRRGARLGLKSHLTVIEGGNHDDDSLKAEDHPERTRGYGWLLRQCRSPCRKLSTFLLCLSFAIFLYEKIRLRALDKERLKTLRVYEARSKVCKRAKWQYYNFPNCNDLHDIGLEDVMIRAFEDRGNQTKIGYLGSGMWRSAISVDPRQDETIVLKMMKAMHEVDFENFDAHRIDALVMERLTKSPYVVDMYGFCGNSVLTEFIPTPLDALVKMEDPDSMGKFRMTPTGRLHMALDVARGMQALHDIPGGPIIHADVAPKQFLVTPTGGVKVSDFNRVRFMGYYKDTGEKCDMTFFLAPGMHRAPEEYALVEQDEKLDIFSMAHVFYTILTGKIAWGDYVYLKPWIAYKTQWGDIPPIPEGVQKTDAALYNLTMGAFALKSQDRPSASQLVVAIEKVLADGHS
jgi:serine/threonine protein kinase